jgi:hypothetical protein
MAATWPNKGGAKGADAGRLRQERNVTSDFIISKAGRGRWRVAAASDRGKAFAADHPRFDGYEAELDPAEALPLFQKIHALGYFASVPDGLPPDGKGRILARVAFALALLLIPLMIFVVLI